MKYLLRYLMNYIKKEISKSYFFFFAYELRGADYYEL